ncbi:MAG: ABC transporter permease [Actinomycetota bacterium]
MKIRSKMLLIFRHEFLHTVKRAGFFILALSLPVLALLGIGVFHIVSGTIEPSVEVARIGYYDESGDFSQYTTQGNIIFINYETQESATQAMIEKDIKEYFIIPQDFISTGIIKRYVTQRELAAPPATAAAIDEFLSNNLLAGKVPESTIARIESPPNLITTTLTSTGDIATQQGGYANFVIPGVFSLLLALSLMFNSSYVLESLGEEKENRLMEILLSSVSTRQLLAGKVLGRGTAGLIQVIVWVISIPLLLRLASPSIGGFISSIKIPPGFLTLGIVYFILGYLLFSVLSAAVAAISPTIREANALASIYTLSAFVPLWFLSLIMYFPNNPIWIVFSIFPFSAPVMIMLRLGITGVPVWQIAVSIAVLLSCIIGGLFLAAKLLGTYILMYGKRPNLKEIIRSFRSL